MSDHEHGELVPCEHARPTWRARLALFGLGLLGVIAVLLFVLVLVHRRSTSNEDERARREQAAALGPEITVATARAAPPTRTIVLPGDVRPWRLAVVYARVSGYLDRLYVDRGDRVGENQLLARVTTPETELQLEPLEASLQSRRAIANRLRPLVPEGLVSKQDLDAAEADVQTAKSGVDRLRAFRNFQDIRAPFAGVVTQRYVDVGALMPAPTGSTQSAQPLVDISDLSWVRVVIYVGQRDATGIRVGDPVTIARESDPARTIAATVSRLPVQLDLQTRTMWVEADVPNPGDRLYPGTFVTVTLHVPAQPGVLIPSDAITLVQGQAKVAVIEHGIAHFRPVEITDDDGVTARVVKGLAPGAMIASRVSDELRDGGPVRPRPAPPPKAGLGGGIGSGSAAPASTQPAAVAVPPVITAPDGTEAPPSTPPP